MLLIIEAFFGGSHRQLVETLIEKLQLDEANSRVVTMAGKKWHWRARTSALYLSRAIPSLDGPAGYSTLFTSSVTPLTDLLALRPDLASATCRKVLYFHENQLIYPARRRCVKRASFEAKHSDVDDMDYQYGFNQILSCLVADSVVFNSNYNMCSFLDNVDTFLRRQPDYKVSGVAESIRRKSSVVYFPLSVPRQLSVLSAHLDNSGPLHILWSHRWEHDKNPALFFETLHRLHEERLSFVVSVIGESFSEVPEVFTTARDSLSSRIVHWGFQQSRADYWKVLLEADCVVSTADHEFFGVAVLEAMCAGCWPVCPARLSYPEILRVSTTTTAVVEDSASFSVAASGDLAKQLKLYRTAPQLCKILREICRQPWLVRRHCNGIKRLAARFEWSQLEDRYRQMLGFDVASTQSVS